ncbi:MAG: M20/M25/M40 family metallo-hydrolase [Gemmatimonadetes bacterium]|nr:M20/M25/M40 family metallo-hydrolase [Gemmatimonadota bacterium]
MKSSSLELLKSLLDSPGPSGFEAEPARIWRTEAESFADSVEVDVGGNCIAAINPDADSRVMFAGHVDEIGIMLSHVDDNGFIYFSTIGGWDHQVFVGQRVVISTRKGQVRGVIGKKPIHLIKSDDRDTGSKVTDLWIDIGSRTKNETLKRIRVGDPGVLASTALDFPHGRLVSRSIDNRIGAFVVLEALRLLAARRPASAVFAVATAREEIAWTGGGAKTSAAGIDPSVAIVVDVTHATDHPNLESKEHGDVKLGKGPVLSRGSSVSSVVFEMLAGVAEAQKIPYQTAAAPTDTGTDADAIHTTLRGVPTGLISIPNRYMHSPNEMVELADVDKAAKLLAAFARKVKPTTDFRPL